MANFELVIRGGTVFDGTGAAPITADVGIRDGRVAAVASGLPDGARNIDASGRWVMPGLLDVHTHYDAEVLLSSGLVESVRHGTTSIILGNCSLSTVTQDRASVTPERRTQFLNHFVTEVRPTATPRQRFRRATNLPNAE